MPVSGDDDGGMTRVRVFAWLLLPLPLLLVPALPTAFVSGTVKSESGEPIDGAVVRIQGQAACTRAAADGTFRLPGKLPPGARLTASKPGQRIGWIDAAPFVLKVSPPPPEDNDDYEWIAPG